MLVKKHLFIFLFIFMGSFAQQEMLAQCTTPINTFPYDENFEANDGNWVRSSSSHWEWGQIGPKPVITAAGGGSKSWIAGGLSGSSYNSGSSNLRSPCFDISSLSFPEISFKIFWETEKRFDGASLQFSTDGGASWLNLGSINSNSTCQGVNWFNYDPVNFLSGPGWSGNIQPTSGSCVGGGGSGLWLTARHSLQSIVGSTGVIFRFVFAAGTTCNNFDGFAVDDIHIGETPANATGFTYTCNGSNITTFTNTATGCKTGVLWDFGDPASGTVNNASTSDNPAHTFSGAGSYLVSLTTNFATGPAITITNTVNIITASAVVSNVSCSGADGAIAINVNPAGTYTYTWNTNPVQTTASINNLAAGTYTVTVTGNNSCPTTLPVTLPAAVNNLQLLLARTDATCGLNNGKITTDASDGVAPYTYLWSNAATTSFIDNLAPGTYSVLLTDANGCQLQSPGITIENIVINLPVSLGRDTSLCAGQTLLLNPGNFATYKWQDNSISPTYTVSMPGTYSVTVTDNTGCNSGFASIKIMEGCREIYFPSGFTPNGDGRNDGFGPLPVSALSSLKNYRLTVYGRWGEAVFNSTDPFERWNGNYKGKPLPTQVLTWMVRYTPDNLLPVFEKGTVSIIR